MPICVTTTPFTKRQAATITGKKITDITRIEKFLEETGGVEICFGGKTFVKYMNALDILHISLYLDILHASNKAEISKKISKMVIEITSDPISKYIDDLISDQEMLDEIYESMTYAILCLESQARSELPRRCLKSTPSKLMNRIRSIIRFSNQCPPPLETTNTNNKKTPHITLRVRMH